MNKSKIILALTIALTMIFGSFASAFAAGAPVTDGTESDPIKAVITKLLQMPVGTDIPDAEFKFEVKPVSVDGILYDDSAGLPQMPQLGPNNDGIIVIGYGSYDYSAAPGAIKTSPQESGDIFKDVSFPHAGVFVYEVKEIPGTYSIDDPNFEDMKYSEAKYTLSVYVKESTGNPGVYYIFAISAIIDLLDSDNGESNQEIGDKVDPTPKYPENSGEYSKLTFTNRYVKTNPGTDPTEEDESTLNVSKKVTGDYSSTSAYFDFKMTVTVPSFVKPQDPAKVYNAYVVEEINGLPAVVTSSPNYGGILGSDTYGSSIPFVSGSEVSFSLKHGQKLVFVDTPVGTAYTLEELAANAYKPGIIVVYDGNAAPSVDGALNLGLDASVSQNPLLVGEGQNSADFTNTRDEVAPTGINVNDLPFVAMIFLAIGAVIVFAALKFKIGRFDK